MDPVKRLIGGCLREIRRRQGLTQEQLAERAGITPNYLSGIERGIMNPSLDTLIRLAGALKVSVAELFLFVEAETTPAALRNYIGGLLGRADPERLRLAARVLRVLLV